MYKHFFKRFFDIVLSGIGMIVLLPVYVLLTIYVAVFMGLPVLFGQERIGKGEKPFKLYKFRSMTNKKDANGNLLPESERLTKAGIFLRNSSLDELLRVAAILSEGHPQLRVDFYIVNKRPVLGELTLSAGIGSYTPAYYDYLGSLTDISLMKINPNINKH